jgi:hypothetical protein
MNNPQVVVDFIANTAGLAGGFKDAGTKSDTFGSKVKGLGKIAVAAAGAAGLAALVGTVKVGADELVNASKVGAQTNAVLKSTGGAAGVTAKQVNDLATALMRKSGIDDETIQSGENLLLTFTKVQNKAGKGNDIFTRATKIMLDMSVALGQDTKSSAIQLGKALNDPIKGVTALQRVGVSFTAAQKDQIKALVNSGRTMDAQKLILKELNKEFGGSAVAAGKTLPGQVNILKESFNNLAGDLLKTLVPALATVTKFLVEHPALFKAMVIGVLALAAAMVILNVALAVTAAVTAGIAAPIAIAIAAVVAMIAVGVLLYKNWDKVKAAATTAWNAIKTAILTPLNAIKTAVTTTVNAIETVFGGLATWLTSTAGAALKKALAVIKALFSVVKDGAQAAVQGVKDTIHSIATWLSDTAGAALSRALGVFSGLFNLIKAGASAAVQGVKDAINAVITWIWGKISAVGRAASAIAGAIKAPINAIIRGWNSISFDIPKVNIPSVKILGKKIGGGSLGGGHIAFPQIPYLASGAVVDSPTLAMVGEKGRELVTPEPLLRQLLAENRPEVHVYIGDTELRGIVKTEYVNASNNLARSLLAGAG